MWMHRSTTMVFCLATLATLTTSRTSTSVLAFSSHPQQARNSRNVGALASSMASLLGRQQQQRPASTLTGTASKLRPTAFVRYMSSDSETEYDFDYFVIGAGSGGIASARRAATYGAKVAVAEYQRLGGTCVNVGCVPKKVMWNAADIAETLHDMHHYGFSGTENLQFDWNVLKQSRDKYIKRLNGIYARNIENSGVTKLLGKASLAGDNKVTVEPTDGGDAQTFTAKHILIAVGGKPVFPEGEGIKENSISSDGFFELEELPSKAVVVGAGYVAVELAGVLQALGTDTKLVIRKEKAMRNFDEMIKDTLDEEMQRQGIEILRNTNGVERIEALDNGLKTVHLKNGEKVEDVDVVLVAPGREPNVESLKLDAAGVEQNEKNYIVTNDYSETNVDGIYALGDVVGNIELTPMAIAAGRRLADRLFGPEEYKDAKVSYDLVPTVVFSHPTIGTIGVTEAEAVEKYGEDNVKVYKSKFANLYYGPWQVEPEDKPKTAMKLICAGENELVVGLHVIGTGADEMMQGFGIALKMGATKADFDATIAIHPTASEEFVTMFPWGLSKPATGAVTSPLNGAAPPEPKL